MEGDRQQPTTEAVLGWLSTSGIALGGSPAEAWALERTGSNPSSRTWTFVAHTAKGPHRVFVKRHETDAMFRSERFSLGLMRPFSGGEEKHAVPELLGADDALRVVAMGWVDAQPVGPLLRAAVASRAHPKDLQWGLWCAYEVGRWLSLFEERTRTGEWSEFPTDVIVARIDELNREILERRPVGYTEVTARAVRDVAIRLASSLPRRFPVSAIHSDFSLGHILADRDRIIVIDFGRCAFGPAGRDAMQFWMGLGDMARLNPFVSRARVEKLQEEFRRGCPTFSPIDPLARIYGLLCKLDQFSQLVYRDAGGIRDRVRACVHAWQHSRWLSSQVAGA